MNIISSILIIIVSIVSITISTISCYNSTINQQEINTKLNDAQPIHCIYVDWEVVCKWDEQYFWYRICDVDKSNEQRFLYDGYEPIDNLRITYKSNTSKYFIASEFNPETIKNDWPSHICIKVEDVF